MEIEYYLGRIRSIARRISRNYESPDLEDDLVQEGAIALINAAQSYDESSNADIWTYATPAIRAAMLDYIAANSRPLSVPPERVRLVRRAAALGDVQVICEKLGVSEKVAIKLLEEYKALFHPLIIDDDTEISCGDDPADIYEARLRKKHLLQAMEEVLSVRERNIVKYHLGFDDLEPMTFTELAIRLNYNDASGVQKVYNGAVKKLRVRLMTGEYAAWVGARHAIRETQNKQ